MLKHQTITDPDSDQTSIIFSGTATIETIQILLTVIKEGMEGSDNLSLDFNNTDNVDFSCLQLLCAAHRHAVRTGKKLSLKVDKDSLFYDVVRVSGFSRHQSCSLSPEPTECLWIQ